MVQRIHIDRTDLLHLHPTVGLGLDGEFSYGSNESNRLGTSKSDEPLVDGADAWVVPDNCRDCPENDVGLRGSSCGSHCMSPPRITVSVDKDNPDESSNPVAVSFVESCLSARYARAVTSAMLGRKQRSASILEPVWEIALRGFLLDICCDSSSGCGHQSSGAGWPGSPGRRSVTRPT